LLRLIFLNFTEVHKLILSFLVKAFFVIPNVVIGDFLVLISSEGNTSDTVKLEFFNIS
jgi:hypothetical protein